MKRFHMFAAAVLLLVHGATFSHAAGTNVADEGTILLRKAVILSTGVGCIYVAERKFIVNSKSVIVGKRGESLQLSSILDDTMADIEYRFDNSGRPTVTKITLSSP